MGGIQRGQPAVLRRQTGSRSGALQPRDELFFSPVFFTINYMAMMMPMMKTMMMKTKADSGSRSEALPPRDEL